jgi:hypothetical protein
MKNIILYSFVALAMLFLCQPAYAQVLKYTTGSWNVDTLGNHRAVIQVNAKSDALLAHIDWRRRDHHPEKIDVIVVDAANGKRVNNVYRANINREFGELVFQAPTAGTYYFYYMPHVMSKGNYPKVKYNEPINLAEQAWLAKYKLTGTQLTASQNSKFPMVTCREIQSIDSFNSFYPMEVIASKTEISSLIKKNPGLPFLIFPEYREYSIRMTDDIPQRWVLRGAKTTLVDTVQKGEYYSFQVGLWAYSKPFERVEIKFSDLKSAQNTIKSDKFTCFNTEGYDSEGNYFEKVCSVPIDKVQAFWCGLQVPPDAVPGTYSADVTVLAGNEKPQTFKLSLKIDNKLIANAGVDNPANLSRLKWLNSRLAFDDGIVPPYTAMTLDNTTINLLGRKINLNILGFPASIQSFFDIEMTKLTDKPLEMLNGQVQFVIENTDMSQQKFVSKDFSFTKKAEGAIAWSSESESGDFEMILTAQAEFDGCVEYQVTLVAKRDMDVNDIRLEIPYRNEVAEMMMGLGVHGGKRPESLNWNWDQQKNQDALWIGKVNAGIQTSLKDENYIRPLNTNFYLSKPLNMPPSWFNNGKGGFTASQLNETYLVKAFSGNRTLKKGQELHYNFRLLITPFRPINTDWQWNTRFYHAFKPIDEIVKTGANTVNVHHANAINPYINYPFLRPAEMKNYIDEGHSKNLKVKIYYTVRELTNKAPEMFMLRSLGDEVLSHGKGNGFSWLQEHLDSNYIAAWFVPELKDAAVVNSGVSRWHNFYVEGLNWLAIHEGIDGIYIDDVAFDRTTMKRVRKVLDRNREGAIIDLHSANQYNKNDGFASSTNLYLEHFPYLNRLWFGEYFNYNSEPDYWLTEISGIPYGLMGEMLQDGGNAWRGMIFGMTARLPWAGDPTPVWKIMDTFGIQGSQMIGYWVPGCPVKTDNPKVICTVYKKDKKSLISIASWDKEKTDVKLAIDWAALGISPYKAVLTAIEATGFQPAATFTLKQKITVEPGKGWLLILEEK